MQKTKPALNTTWHGVISCYKIIQNIERLNYSYFKLCFYKSHHNPFVLACLLAGSVIYRIHGSGFGSGSGSGSGFGSGSNLGFWIRFRFRFRYFWNLGSGSGSGIFVWNRKFLLEPVRGEVNNSFWIRYRFRFRYKILDPVPVSVPVFLKFGSGSSTGISGLDSVSVPVPVWKFWIRYNAACRAATRERSLVSEASIRFDSLDSIFFFKFRFDSIRFRPMIDSFDSIRFDFGQMTDFFDSIRFDSIFLSAQK